MVERSISMREVRGSMPLSSIFTFFALLFFFLYIQFTYFIIFATNRSKIP